MPRTPGKEADFLNPHDKTISPLLAAQVRRVPRATAASQPPANRSTLRLATENEAHCVTPTATTPQDIDAVIFALAGIHDLIGELDETLGALQPPRRVSPAQLAALQGRLDQAIAAINDIVKATRVGGRSILSGEGRIIISTEPSSPSFQLCSVAPDSIGGPARSRLGDIRSGQSCDLAHLSLADVGKIVSRAAAQVALERRRLETFVKRPVIAPDAASHVAAENRAAAQQATADLDLVMATSQLTRGHLLAATQSLRAGR